MASLAAGSTVTLTMGAWDSVGVEVNAGSSVIVESPVGTRIAVVNSGGRQFGPYASGVEVKLTAEGSAIRYDVIDGVESPYLTAAETAATRALVSGGGILAALRQSDGYHYAGWARDQIATATKLADQSGNGNDAVLQAGVAAATAWATAGLFTVPNPTGLTDLAEIPTLDFDYAGGETLLVFWRGFATPEASDMPLIGDTGDGSATTRQGLNVISTSAGKLKFWLRDSAGALSASGTSTATVFETATEHSVAVCLDGLTRKYAFWVDGVRDAAFASAFLTFASGATPDTISGRTLKLGGSGRVSGGVQDGIASQTRALHVLRRAIGLGAPTGIDDIVANLHRDPTRLVSAEAW